MRCVRTRLRISGMRRAFWVVVVPVFDDVGDDVVDVDMACDGDESTIVGAIAGGIVGRSNVAAILFRV